VRVDDADAGDVLDAVLVMLLVTRRNGLPLPDAVDTVRPDKFLGDLRGVVCFIFCFRKVII
jgi:hypothetical protein